MEAARHGYDEASAGAQQLIEVATNYLAAGLCVLPAVRAEKRPALRGWKAFQSRLPSQRQLQQWFGNGTDGLCVVAGTVSGNLELIDFDREADQFDAWAAMVPEDLLSRLVIERSQSGGRHVVYRSIAPICGNMKLSQGQRDGKVVTLIETRGEGGLFLCARPPATSSNKGRLTIFRCSPSTSVNRCLRPPGV